MFYLDDKLPNSVELEGEKYNLNLSFDNVLCAFRPLKDPELLPIDRVEVFLSILVDGDLPDQELLVDLYQEVTELLQTEPTKAVRYDINGDPMPNHQENYKPDFDFDFDARYIYAAFLQVYKIDLIDQQGKLHWLKFAMLLNALPEDCVFRQIRQIRSTDLSKIKDKGQKSQLRKQKQAFALPDNQGKEGEDYGG